MSSRRFLRNYWSFLLALLLLLIELTLLIGVAIFQSNYSEIVVRMFLLIEFLGMGFTVICMFLFFLPLLAFLDYRIMNKKVLFFRVLAIFIMLSLYGIDVIAALNRINLTGDIFVFRNAIQAVNNQRQYYLLGRSYSAGDSTYPTNLLVYECDNLGVSCSLIHEYMEYDGGATAKLEYSIEENTISLLIDNVLNYTYEPQ
jgi:hypothetical protein